MARKSNGHWTAKLSRLNPDKPLCVYANVANDLEEPVEGAGYYYRIYHANRFIVSSLVEQYSAQQLKSAGVRKTVEPSLFIEDFEGNWEKDWFTYWPEEWGRSTNKLYDEQYVAPPGAKLAFEVQSDSPNQIVVQIDQHVSAVPLRGGGEWQRVVLSPNLFQDFDGNRFTDWDGIRQLTLTASTRIRGDKGKSRVVGKTWKGGSSKFRNLRWIAGTAK